MEQLKRNKMGTMQPPKLLLNMGVPMVLSMAVQALYNMVDTYFVSHIPDTELVSEMGDKAINALTLANPIQALIIALIVGIGIGTNSMLAQNLGRKDREGASRVAGNAIFLCSICFVLIFLFGLFGAEAFIRSQTSDELIVELGTTYLRIVTVFSLGTIGYMCLEKVAMGCGKTRATMVGQLSGAVVNIILDPILIYGKLGLPAMGVAGAAWATVIGQFVSLFIIGFIVFFRTREISVGWKYLRPCRDVLKRFAVICVPAVFMQVMTPVMAYGMNLVLGAISPAMVTAYGVYYRLQYFVILSALGFNNASIPCVSYNLGAGNKKRMAQIIQWALIYTMTIMVVCVLILQIFTKPIVGVFSIAPDSRQQCLMAVHIVSIALLFAGANNILQGACQAMGNGVYSLIVSSLRYVVLVLPLAWAFSLTGSNALVWASVPIAEAASCVLAIFFTVRLYRKRTAGLKPVA